MTSFSNGASLPNTGAPLLGRVTAPTTVRSLTGEIVGVAGSLRSLQVEPTGGQFAFFVAGENMRPGVTTRVKMVLERTDGTREEPIFQFGHADDTSGIALALNRVSFGATPALAARVKQIGFQAYIEEQLDPLKINDAAFAAMNTDALLSLAPDPTKPVPYWKFEENKDFVRFATAAYSNKQLLEVMTNFWENHFWTRTEDAFRATNANHDENIKYRQLAFGTFRDLLFASAKNGLMMDFLDNNTSRANSINENYARELLELHTVGVNGGYGDADVFAVARILTGWSYEQFTDPRFPFDVPAESNVRFIFEPTRHDTTSKTVPFLTRTFIGRSGADGVKEGEELLEILANHPKTREFVCGKIVALLVSDAKPASFVQRCVATWGSTNGNIGQILRTILLAADYRADASLAGTKVKTPFEYGVGLVRHAGLRAKAGREQGFYSELRNLHNFSGQNFAEFGVPTGFPEAASSWMGAASLLSRGRRAGSVLTSDGNYSADYQGLAVSANMLTAEAVASYLLGYMTGDRYRQEEFDSVVSVLKGADGRLDMSMDQKARIRRAIGLIVVLPSYQLQ